MRTDALEVRKSLLDCLTMEVHSVFLMERRDGSYYLSIFTPGDYKSVEVPAEQAVEIANALRSHREAE